MDDVLNRIARAGCEDYMLSFNSMHRIEILVEEQSKRISKLAIFRARQGERLSS
jgi:hypothetical protein